MAQIFKFVYVMIIFIYLFLILTNVDGKPLFNLPKFSSILCKQYFILSSYILFILFFITAGIRCHDVSECPKGLYCKVGSHMECVKHQCKCIKNFEPIDPA